MSITSDTLDLAGLSSGIAQYVPSGDGTFAKAINPSVFDLDGSQ
jgi:hypothetical protein